DKPLTVRKAKKIAQELTVTESQLIALLLNDRQGKKTKSRLPVPDNFNWQAVARRIMSSEQSKPSYMTKTITRPYAYRNFKNAITKAKKMLNIKYLWGGTTPRGFDCSGLVQYTYRAAGIHLPRTAATQYRATKRIRHQRDARAGDLVFFHLPIARKVYINHVGIYLGGNRVLHAPGEGTRIAIDNLDTIRWSRFVVAYGRPMKNIRSKIVMASY
ncbi:MAG TPA: NlpC/P60 family protein, partial [Thiotrichaceae bacterium]|nr:NlpC/P60 family protein [Thiotrichaceae bacterium]